MKARILAGAAALALAAGAAQAGDDVVTYAYDGSFDDAAFSVQNEIIDRGLVIDYVSHVGDMLNRTAADVGATKKIFDKADVFLFCSAVLSRKVMEADPMNVAHCPYGIFVADMGGKVVVGHRVYPDGPMKEVEALLDDIARKAVSE
ncbi:MAG: DUF302 domain-containing protein [Alphaproteobacteria bacterium]|nr:MAG: DUF302 domain-containing protein [Alphaproteobacteria bacterium]